MGDHRYRMERFWHSSVFSELPTQDKPIIEIVSDHRILVENHNGVKEYTHEKIVALVSFGCLCITGLNLELMRMTKEQLVICGKIGGIQFIRKELP